MADPVEIYVGGRKLQGWTEMSLQRGKGDMTGTLSVSMFFTYMPAQPVAVDATKNKTIVVYVGGHVAFTGNVDTRKGSGTKSGNEGTTGNDRSNGFDRTASIGAEEYTVKLSARGKTKVLIDSSHQHETTNMLKPTTRQAIEKLVQPWNIDLDWKAETVKLDKLRFRDGAKVFDELSRIGSENAHFIYETRDGKLRVTDDTGREQGEPLVLGRNILTFSAEQSESPAKSRVKVKGQRTDKTIRGAAAVLNIEKELKDSWVEADIPFTIQHYGDGTPEALERRANFETNKRSSASKKLTVDVFHVQQSDGAPWDIGKLHYCEVPPEGIFDTFECTELTYTVQNDTTIKTTLTLSPPPASSISTGKAGLGAIAGSTQQVSSRRRAAGVTLVPGQYPAPWSGPDVAVLPAGVTPNSGVAARALLSDLSKVGPQ